MVQAWRLFRATMRQQAEVRLEQLRKLNDKEWEGRMVERGFNKGAIEKVRKERKGLR